MKRIFFPLILLSISISSYACLNETRTNARGQEVSADDDGYYFPGYRINPNEQRYLNQLSELDRLWRTNHNIDDYSDYGVKLVYLGRFEAARDVFIEIESIQPGRYATAANLGTIYELLGENQKALHWIKKAVEIDPTSHFESEWIHVKILEAKLSGDSLITSEFLLSTSFGDGDIPVTKLSDDDLWKLGDALAYQLQERVSLVRPPDEIVGLLLFELGNIQSITMDVDQAIYVYDKAIEYGFKSVILEKRRKKFEEMSASVRRSDYAENGFNLLAVLGFSVVIGIVALPVIIFVWRIVVIKKLMK